MLDLNSGIDLDEIEFTSILVDQKLHSPGVIEMDRFAEIPFMEDGREQPPMPEEKALFE